MSKISIISTVNLTVLLPRSSFKLFTGILLNLTI